MLIFKAADGYALVISRKKKYFQVHFHFLTLCGEVLVQSEACGILLP